MASNIAVNAKEITSIWDDDIIEMFTGGEGNKNVSA